MSNDEAPTGESKSERVKPAGFDIFDSLRRNRAKPARKRQAPILPEPKVMEE